MSEERTNELNIPKPGPAQSATTDEAQTTAPEPQATPTPAAPAPTPTPRPLIQERFSEVTAQRRAAEARAAAAEAQLAKYSETLDKVMPILEKMGQGPAAPQPSQAENVSTRPNRAQFETPEDYEEALILHVSQQVSETTAKQLRADFEKREAERQEKEKKDFEERNAAQQQERLQSEFDRRCAEFKAAVPEFDFDELSSRPGALFPISQFTANAIMLDEYGPAILHHLGQHPEEAVRIAQLPPIRQISEIGRLGAAFMKQATPNPTTATMPAPENNLPPPIEPLNSGSSGGNNGAEPSMEDWASKRLAQLQAERRSSGAALPPRS